jgi:hypothetical protein
MTAERGRPPPSGLAPGESADLYQATVQNGALRSAEHVIKNPFVLEFLDKEEKSAYSEHALETAIIDHLGHFLLELGKGFLFEARITLIWPHFLSKSFIFRLLVKKVWSCVGIRYLWRV